MKKKKRSIILSCDQTTGHFNSVLISELFDTDPKQLVSAKKLVPSMILADSEKFFEPHYILKNLNFYTKKEQKFSKIEKNMKKKKRSIILSCDQKLAILTLF